jgi:hypothetical protein
MTTRPRLAGPDRCLAIEGRAAGVVPFENSFWFRSLCRMSATDSGAATRVDQGPTEGALMYIGIGTVVLILVILLLVGVLR